MNITTLCLNTLFPIRCIGCGFFDMWLCDKCVEQLPLLDEQHCFVCKESQTSYSQKCPTCLKESTSTLDALLIASTYQDPLLKKAIHYYKYRFIADFAPPLATVLRQVIVHAPDFPAPNLIIPVPLHQRRLRWRGFNQATLLAKTLNVDIPIEEQILVRTRHTQPQMTLTDRAQRLVNLDDAFEIREKQKTIDKTILLIDDITTTGTTLEQCAKLLKAAGAKKVYGLVLARE